MISKIQTVAGYPLDEAREILDTYGFMSKTPFWQEMQVKMKKQQLEAAVIKAKGKLAAFNAAQKETQT